MPEIKEWWKVRASFSPEQTFYDLAEAEKYYDACVNNDWNAFVWLIHSDTIKVHTKDPRTCEEREYGINGVRRCTLAVLHVGRCDYGPWSG